MIDIFKQMKLHADKLTPREREVYDIALDNPDVVLGSTATEIASRYGISQSAISRFCQKVGFSGYGEFRMCMYRSIWTREDFSNSQESTSDYAVFLANLIRDTRATFPDAMLAPIAEYIARAHRIFLVGAGASSIASKQMAMSLIQLSLPASVVENGWESEILHYTDDNCLVILYSSRNPTYRDFLTTAKDVSSARKPRLMLVTTTAKHPLRKLVDEQVTLPTWKTLRYPVYIEPIWSMLAFNGILATYMLTNKQRHDDVEA